MTLKESKDSAASQRPVEKDKFDRHMKKARRTDVESRQEAFILQSERAEAQSEKISGIKPSVY